MGIDFQPQGLLRFKAGTLYNVVENRVNKETFPQRPSLPSEQPQLKEQYFAEELTISCIANNCVVTH